MKLIEMVEHLKSVEKAESLIATEIPDVDFGYVDIYLKDELNINSEVVFFDVDTIPNNLEIDVDGIHYINLFPLPMAQEMIQEYWNSSNQKLKNTELAQRILQYRITDA